MSALREIIAKFGFEVDDTKLKHADKGLEEFVGKVQTLGRALIGGAAAVGLLEFANGLAEQGAALNNASLKLGIGTDALQALGFAAKQSGADLESLTTGLLVLQDKVGDALINKTGEGAKAFQKYGIHIRDAAGNVKGADELLGDVAERMGKSKTEAEKLTIAVDLFGKQGRALLPMLKGGKEGLAAMREEFEALGGGFGKDAVEAARNYDDALGRLRLTFTSLRGRIATVLLPILQKVVDFTTKIVAKFLELSKNSSIIQAALLALGTVLGYFAIKSALAFAPWLAWAAALGVILLVLDDVITMFRGGKSVIGEFIDSIGGAGTAVSVVRDLRDAFSGMLQALKDSIAAFTIFRKLVAHEDLSESELAAMARLTGVEAALSRGVRGRNTLDQQRLDAAKNGLTFAAPGESLEQARAETEKLLAAQKTGTNLPPSIEGSSMIPRGIVSLPIPSAASSTVNAPVNAVINVNGAQDPQATGRAVEEALTRVQRDARGGVIRHAEAQ